MEIKPTYVTFEQAKWLKEIGFDIYSNVAYNGKGEVLDESPTYNKEYYMTLKDFIYRPEQWQVVEWLRVKHSIWISVYTMDKFLPNGNDRE
ncbi:MAG TPA: hypothetical protein PKI83_02870, partial [Bacteroidales bacterium]|nr:hypothetical protein [Bacteroidales bacterium]